MIYTITFNPSLDYIVEVDNLKMGEVNRASYESIQCGGKGINVSIVLNRLGIKSTALGFIAGFTGEQLSKELSLIGCPTDFIHLSKGLTRINIKLKSNQETEINGMGPEIDSDSIKLLYQKLDKLESNDLLVLAGSIPSCVAEFTYEEIMKRVAEKKVAIVVDTTGSLLTSTLKYKPFLIKPNHIELGEIFSTDCSTTELCVENAKKLQAMGARNVLISRGKNGAVLVAEDGEIFSSGVVEGKLIHAVGSGDSMVAGFLAGYLSHGTEHGFLLGIAAGCATAFSEGLAEKEPIMTLYQALKIKNRKK